jgi:bisphosphoglycerate-dependent phosphoglycerate mutase
MPKTIYFIRHGETDFNTDPVPRIRGRVPVPLNETGLRHAAQAGEFLKNEKITNRQTTNTFTNGFDPDARINPTQNNTPTTTYYDVDKRIVIK